MAYARRTFRLNRSEATTYLEMVSAPSLLRLARLVSYADMLRQPVPLLWHHVYVC